MTFTSCLFKFWNIFPVLNVFNIIGKLQDTTISHLQFSVRPGPPTGRNSKDLSKFSQVFVGSSTKIGVSMSFTFDSHTLRMDCSSENPWSNANMLRSNYILISMVMFYFVGFCRDQLVTKILIGQSPTITSNFLLSLCFPKNSWLVNPNQNQRKKLCVTWCQIKT